MAARRTLKKGVNLAGLAFCVLLGCSVYAGATSLTQYRRAISLAIAEVHELQELHHDLYLSNRDQVVDAHIARIREYLPPGQTVTVEQQLIQVDNQWLSQALNTYRGSSGNHTQGPKLLAPIEERLRALDDRLEAWTNGTTAKDDDKARLAEILRRAEYKQTTKEDSAFWRMINRFLEWLKSLLPKRGPVRPGGPSPSTLSGIAQLIVISLCVVAIAFFIWRFGPRLMRDWGKRKKKKTREARIVLGEHLEPDQTAADLLAQAEGLARKGDLRGAIRKAYIALLCELGDRKVISLAQHKTNRDYLNSVRDRSSLYASMRGLTNAFEQHWYGFQPPAENDWNEFRTGYFHTLKISPGG